MHKLFIIFIFLSSCESVFAQSYTYDELGRVTSETIGTKTTTYTYDAADNRTSTITTAGNSAPTCTNPSIYLNSVPTSASPVSIQVSAAQFLGYCSDADGNSLTLVTPSTTPYTFTIAAGKTVTISFSVSDQMSTTSATLTYRRP